MPFQIIRNDITKIKADAIVNTANPNVAVGDGVDSAIYKAAGKEKLLEARKKIGLLMLGEVAITDVFDLDAKYIIHQGRIALLYWILKIQRKILREHFFRIMKILLWKAIRI